VTSTPDEALRSELLALAERLAREAGTMALRGRRSGRALQSDTKSTATDVVTEYDRASEELIVAGLRSARPHDALLGEEGTSTPGTSGIEWLIDPIDGTTNFLYDLPGWGVSIAARSETDTEVGVVYVPTTDEMFTAVRGGGAHLNGQPIRCSTTTDLTTALVATGFGYRPERRAAQARRLEALLPRVRDLRRFGAAAPDLCYVAAGRVDAYYEEWLNAWDLAAGELIAREAGCISGSIDGGPVRPSSALVTAPGVFDAVQSLLAEIDATR
jgi:myo-inositol-1(or 4)-monophosphatase